MKIYKNLQKKGFILLTAVLLLWGSRADAGSIELPEGLNDMKGESINTFVYAIEDTKGYEKPDAESQVKLEIKKDKKVLMVLKLDEKWGQILDKGNTVYVELRYFSESFADKAISEEINELEQIHILEAEQDIAVRKRERSSRIWGGIIIFLIAGVFIAGIIAVLHSKDREIPTGNVTDESMGSNYKE